MRELPVEDAGQPAIVHEVVAGAKIAVHQRQRSCGRRIRVEPRQDVLECGPRIAGIVDTLIQPGLKWVDDKGVSRPLRLGDILIVAPYNAQVSDLAARLPGARIGTVDKFQGQEAPVVIYSLTTSSPEDAPRGMEFLYSLNRLNVATSRAQAMVIVVGSPRLLEPECRSPRQMQLANALCRYVELSQVAETAARTVGGN